MRQEFWLGKGSRHPLARLVDDRETYGRHIIERFTRAAGPVSLVMDLGAGAGEDLRTVRRVHPGCTSVAVDSNPQVIYRLSTQVSMAHELDIEREPLPAATCSVDLVVANQVLEHTKEIFWIFHQVFRVLRVGGHLILGVPNLASLHNRLLLLLGNHPTQHKLLSAHVRPFSRRDTVRCLRACFPGCSVRQFAGAQFYPFPRIIARPLADIFPSLAFSIFFLIRKDSAYHGEFASYPSQARLETNFFCGKRTIQLISDTDSADLIGHAAGPADCKRSATALHDLKRAD